MTPSERPRSMSGQVFVSYSHQDASLVSPVVRLLRSTNDLVFLDSDSIKPGTRWRPEIMQAIERASLVVVFWCRHSSKSSEVEREYRSAIGSQKDIVPVLLDSTTVPPALNQFQWIDFRELGRKRHADIGSPARKALAAAKGHPFIAGTIISVALVGGAALWFYRLVQHLPVRAVDPYYPFSGPGAYSEVPVLLPLIIATAIGAAMALVFVWWTAFRARYRTKDLTQAMATRLGMEVERRFNRREVETRL